MEWQVRDKLILFVGSIGVTAAVVLFFKHIFPLAVPFAVGFLIALILEKPVKWLAKKFGGKQMLASIVVTIVLALSLLGLLIFIGAKACEEIKNFFEHFDYYQTMALTKLDDMCCNIDSLLGMDKGKSISVISENMDTFMENMQGDMVHSVIDISIPVIVAIVGFFAAVTVLFISIVYLGRDLDKIRQWQKTSIFSVELRLLCARLAQLGNAYFKVQGIIILCNSAICSIGLLLLGNPYGLVLGILIGLLDALPIFGTGTVFIPWSLICLVMGKFGRAAAVYSLYLITYFLREIMESKMMGSRLGIAPLTMLFIIYVGILIYGFWGFIIGPISYCIIKELILYLKKLLERDKITLI